MFILKGRYLETTSYFDKKSNETVKQAVIYSEGDGKTYSLTGYSTVNLKPFDSVEIPVTVGCYDNKIYLRVAK